MSRTRLEWAQWMASKGISAFIVNPDGKTPLGGNSWYLRNTTEPQQLADWFDMELNCNYGLWLGEKHVVVDLDVEYSPDGFNGTDNFEAICLENDIADFRTEIKTLMVRTPSGGYHLYFKTPRPCANKNLFPDHIDTRGGQGYVVGPGSYVDDGKVKGGYEVIDPDAPIMEIPSWLLEFMVSPGFKDPNHSTPLIELDQPENIEQAMAFLKAENHATADGTGDTFTYDTCCYLRDFGISEGEALRLMFESGWNARCEPPWDAAELAVKIENSYRFGQNRPGVKAVTYKKEKLMQSRPAGGWASVLSDEQVAAMGRPKTVLDLVVDNTKSEDQDDEEVPEDVGVEEDPLNEFKENKQLWYGIEDFAAIEQVREYLIKDWLIAHGVTALLAKRGTGKSTIALDLGCHLAKDMPWWGIPVMKDWKVIYICGEDDEGMILNVRAWAQYEDRGLPANDRFLIAKGIIKMTDKQILAVRLKEMQEWAGDARCLIILDTWARATSGYSSISQEEMDLAYESAELLAETLKGPMLACFHPPKDGRMTIRGSAVMEDASSGIWELEEVSDGIQLTVGRAKGKGKGNFRKFNMKPLNLPGEDFYGEPLQGMVPVKFSGTEDIGTPVHMKAAREQRRAWAKAVIGALKIYPTQKMGVEISNTAQGIAKFLTNLWVERERAADPIDQAFVSEWMNLLDEHDQLTSIVSENNYGQIEHQLKTRFLKGDHSEVVIDGYSLYVEQESNKKARFAVREANPGIEE